MKTAKLTALAAAIALAASSRSEIQTLEGPCMVREGETVVFIGDSITEGGFCHSYGFYHIFTNAMEKVNFVPLGFGGYQVKSWSDMERSSVTNAAKGTWYRGRNWKLKEVFDGKVDHIVIFLGMNDILQPSLTDDDASLNKWLADYISFVSDLRKRCNPKSVILATITPLTGDEASPKNLVRERLNNRMRAMRSLGLVNHVAETGAGVAQAAKDTAILDDAYRVVPDFVHPRSLGHIAIAREIAMSLGLSGTAGELDEKYYGCLLGIADKNTGKINLKQSMLRTAKPGDDEFVYTLSVNTDWNPEGPLPKVSVMPPEGWTVDRKSATGGHLTFFLRGRPSRSVNNVRVEAHGHPAATVAIPAPWKIRDEKGPWQVYSANEDYTGGARPGSIDPFQLYFGTRTNTIWCARRVKSEKAREVTAVFSHQTFSATLDLELRINGELVFADNLDRRGRNRSARKVALKEGWNDIEIKCVNRDWQRQFSFDFEPIKGDDLSLLEYSLK